MLNDWQLYFYYLKKIGYVAPLITQTDLYKIIAFIWGINLFTTWPQTTSLASFPYIVISHRPLGCRQAVIFTFLWACNITFLWLPVFLNLLFLWYVMSVAVCSPSKCQLILQFSKNGIYLLKLQFTLMRIINCHLYIYTITICLYFMDLLTGLD